MNNDIIKWLFDNEINEFSIVEMDKNRYQLEVEHKHYKEVLTHLSRLNCIHILSVETALKGKGLFNMVNEDSPKMLYVEYEPAKSYAVILDGGIKLHE